MDNSTFVAIVAVIVSAFAAFIAWKVPHHVEIERQRSVMRELKIDTLRRVMGLRAQPPTKEWASSLNEIAVVFNDSTPVISTLVRFEGHIRIHGGHSNELLVELLTAMMEDLKLTAAGLDGEFLLRPFGAASH